MAGAVANVENVHLPVEFADSIYHTIDVRLVSIEQMSQMRVLPGHGTSMRMLFQAQDGVIETQIPLERGIRTSGFDFGVEKRKVALRSGRDINGVCHAGLQTL